MKITQRQKVKRILEERGSITNVEAMHELKCFRLSERIRELQADGMQIAGDFVQVDGRKTGTYRYTLAGGPKPRMVPITVMVDGMRMTRLVPEQSV